MDAIFYMLVYGGIYGMIGMSFNVLYRPTNVFNFAQGSVIVIGSLLASTLLATQVPWLVALLGGTLAGGVLAVAIDFVGVQPILKRDSASQSWLITTLAVSLAADDLMGKIWGGEARQVRYPYPFSASYVVRVGDTGLSNYSFVLIVVPFLVLAALWLGYRTRMGRAVRAVAEERQGAVLRGIDPVVLTRWSWFLGGALASFVGVLAAPLLFASVTLGPTLLVSGFMAVAIGGVGNNTGALIGGYLVALIEGLAALRISSYLASLATFAVLLVVLLIRPSGLFSEQQARRV
ncbi:MAG TPA: branched-chain amino acid ABC transporter permease [Streptosporangiaceae bacterium]|nr:branched-chain amino acid ABC transporter permease [Streptosporangiaceae bacterium]